MTKFNHKLATILVVDDAPNNIDLVHGLLKDKYKIKVTINGEKALNISKKIPPPDLILLDVYMPGMDGYEVCRQLKKNPRTKEIPVIFLSSSLSKKEIQTCYEVGAIAYLGKPFEPNKLLEAVSWVLGKK